MKQKPLSNRLTPEQQQLVLDNIRLVTFVCNNCKAKWIARLYPTWEDAIAQATLGLCRAVATWRPGESKISSYATKCIFNALVAGVERKINFFQKTGFTDICEYGQGIGNCDVPDYRSGADPADYDWPADRVKALMRHLSPAQQKAVRSFVANDMRSIDVGKQLGMTGGGALMRLYSIRKKFRKSGVVV